MERWSLSRLVAAATMLGAVSPAGAESLRAVWDADGGGVSPPALWLAAPGSMGTANLPGLVQFGILPAPDPPAMAVTVFFSEDKGKGLQATWTTARNSVILSNNLFDGIGMDNRRVLVIPASLLDAPGTLTFEDPSGKVRIERAVFEWLSSQRVWVSPGANDVALVTENLDVLGFDAITGGTYARPEDRWSGSVLRAVLYDEPVQLAPRKAFEFEIDTAPARLRLEALVAGLPPEAVTRVFLNGTYAGALHVEVPSLADPGYRDGAFIGWRKATALLPAGLLTTGLNRIWFEWQTATPPAPPFLGLREIALELDYSAAGYP